MARLALRIAPAASEVPRRLARLPELAAQAETLGFDLLVVPERLSAEGGFPAALPVCAAAAAATQRLRVATGLVALPLHHPLRIAEDAATLDALSGGRFELGVGLGAEREAAGGFGLDHRVRAARFEEALEIVRRAWAEGPVRFRGAHFRCEGIEVYPKPLQAGGPPLWLGARSADALERVAQLGCGVVLEPGTEPAPYLAGWEAGGRDPDAARIAFLVEAAQLDGAPLRERIASAGAARVDLWIEAPGELGKLEALWRAAGNFRATP